MADQTISHGITMTWATSAWAPTIVDVNPAGQSREDVDTTHQGTIDFETKEPLPIAKLEDATITIHYDPTDTPPITEDPETITISGEKVDGSTWSQSFEGYLKSISPKGAHKSLMTADITIGLTGGAGGSADPITRTSGAGAGS